MSDRDSGPSALATMLTRWIADNEATQGKYVDVQVVFNDASMSGGKCFIGEFPDMFSLRQPAVMQRGQQVDRIPGKDVEIHFHASDIKRLVRIVDGEPESGLVVPQGAAGPRRIFSP